MKNVIAICCSSLLFLTLQSCHTTFFGTVLTIRFQDLITYVLLALGLAVFASLMAKDNGRTVFWMCFILSLLLTPLAGLIYCLILITRKQ